MWLYHLNHRMGPVIGAYWSLRLVGETGSIPRDGGAIVAANHASFLDPWWIGMSFPRPIRFLITRDWYERSPGWERLFRAFGVIPVEEGSPRNTLEAVGRILDRGEVVGVFPEGRISADGTLQSFRSGVARIAHRSAAPVVPIGLHGNFASLPKGRRLPRPVRVAVHVGAPMRIEAGGAASTPANRCIREFTEALRQRIAALSGAEDGDRTA